MADDTDLADDDRKPHRSGRVRRIALVGAGTVALVLGGVWGARERIAANLIDRELASLQLPMQYRIVSIGLGREVLGSVVVGDPMHPDLTVDRVEVVLRYGLGGPQIDRLALIKPRLHGRVIDGQVHLGALDRVLYAPSSGEPLRLPEWLLVLSDARGRIDSDFGPLAFSADGQGRLSDGFAGTVGVVMPQAHAGACDAVRTTLFGHVTTQAGKPRIDGPLRSGGVRCGDTRLDRGRIDLAIAGDTALSSWSIGGRLALGKIDSGHRASLMALGGEAGLRWQAGQSDLSGRITLDLHGLTAPQVRLDQARFDGMLHARGLAGIDLRGDIDGKGLARGTVAIAAIDRMRGRARGTPVAPLLDRAAMALARQEPGSRVAGSLGLHVDAADWRLVMPMVQVHGGQGGQTLARFDRLVLTGGAGKFAHLAGNFTTGGGGLPAITGAMTAGGASGAQLRIAMAPYTADAASLAVPDMVVTPAAGGAFGFAGTVALSGPLGQGRIDRLVVPVDGALTGNGQLALLRHCVTPRFDRLRTGSLDLAHGAVRLCPVSGAMVRAGANGVALAATMPGLAMAGTSADAPVGLRTGAARIAWPGTSTVDALDVTMGRGADAQHVHVDSVSLGWTNGVAGGTFAGGNLASAALPAKLGAAGGAWQLDGGHVTISGGTLLISDTAIPARFAPVGARDAMMTWADGAVTASARLIAPHSGDGLARVTLRHDPGSGRGHAEVTIPGLTFRTPDPKTGTRGLQPTDLSDLAKGIAALANGTITGSAKFDWNTAAPGGGLTGSGRISSDDLDFAGDLGPVEGLAGTIEFTDLIHLVTAPHQHLKLASINPGIEVTNGDIDLDLHEGLVVRLNRARWPFEGGTIDLEPTELHFGVVEPRRFAVLVTGLEAGRFLQHMNMSNLSATGMFDGRLPLVFDANGGRITGGQLVSRAPGGNVSYVGALSYRDLSPMANYAFKMLRSVDYHTMTIGLEGDLSGEVVTKVSFGGISQGQGAERNVITRQLARLPIRFDINVRTQFYQLINTLRSLYDPSLIPDPRDKGPIDAQGRPLHHHGAVTVGSPTAAGTGGIIQHQASGAMP